MARTLKTFEDGITAADLQAGTDRLADRLQRTAEHARRACLRRLPSDHPLADEAAMLASLQAVAMAGRPEHAQHSPESLARLAAMLLARTALEQQASKRDRGQVEIPAGSREDIDRMAPLYWSPTAPDAMTRTTDTDRLDEALALDPLTAAQADMLAMLTYLDPAPHDSRAWKNGLPSASSLLEAYGLKNTGRNRGTMATRLRDALAAIGEALEAVNHQHAPARPRRSQHSDDATLALAESLAERLALSRRQATRSADPIPSSGPASQVWLTLADGTHALEMADGTRVASPGTDAHRAMVLRSLDRPAWSAPRRDKGEPADPTASPATQADALALEASTGPDRPGTPVPGVTPGLASGTSGAPAGVGTPYRAPKSSKRKRDGAVGGSMTRA